MKKKISFKTWIFVFFGGIWQFVRGAFSWKNKGIIGKLVAISIGVLAIMLSIGVGYAIYDDIQRQARYGNYITDLSNHLQFVSPYSSNKPGWIRKVGSSEKLIKDVDWVVVPETTDSLAVFSQNGKRGYINRYNGRIVIPAKYDAAWVFSNGLAAVDDGDNIIFINDKGEQTIDKKFPRDYRINYVFHGDHCIMNGTDGSYGLIDSKGNWVVNPEYDEILPATHNYWKMGKGDEENRLWYAFTDSATPVEMDGVKTLDISEDLGVIYSLPNHMQMVVDFDGNRQELFLCQDIEPMHYTSDNRDKDGDFVQERTTLYSYRMADGYEGLCNPNGDTVTAPLYWAIKPISKDLYLCTYKDTNSAVIINSKGEVTMQ